jgi:hypothetical protein
MGLLFTTPAVLQKFSEQTTVRAVRSYLRKDDPVSLDDLLAGSV